MKGFFTSKAYGKKPLPLAPQCGACGLHLQCNSPKMALSGSGHKSVLIVGEAPGQNEDQENRPFCGPAGWLLERHLRNVGIDMRRDCWITNALRCRPPDNKIDDDKKVVYCRPYVLEAIQETQPKVVILFGKTAVKSVIGWLWKEEVGAMSRWAGWRIPSQRLNAWICPTFHPSYVLRETKDLRKGSVAEMIFSRHLNAVARLVEEGERPWPEGAPEWRKKVKIVLNSEEVVYTMERMSKNHIPAAIDFETDRLKPDGEDSKIVCCAVSDGEVTISFPWTRETEKAVKGFLISPCPKIGYNQKFETRWAMRVMGVMPENWVHDGMLAAHCLDNRKAIASLKFQSFVLLGQGSYNDHIDPYLEAEGGNTRNRVREIDPEQLMLYCGLDAYLEWRVAQVQMKEMGRVT